MVRSCCHPSGQKNAHAHRVPLSSSALAILGARSKREGRDFIFGSREGAFTGWSRTRYQLDARIHEMTGEPLTHWTPHDLRRTCATRMAELGIQPHVIEAILNHRGGAIKGVAEIYNRHSYSTEKRAALDRWASHLLAIVEGREDRRRFTESVNSRADRALTTPDRP